MKTLRATPISHRFSFVFPRIDLRALRFKALVVLFVLCGNQDLVFADTYPIKPIRIVVPYPPGAFNDTLGRTFAQKLTEKWKQPVVVDNRPGAGSTLGTGIVARSAPDGYTLLVVSFAFAVNPALYASLPYDTEKDFVPIVLAAGTANMLVVHPTLPVKSVKDLIALAKTKPGKLNYASAGTGSSPHLCMELFKTMASVDLVHVPYKGSVPAVTDLMGGQVDVICDNAPNVLQHIRAGKLRALAVTGIGRSPVVPDLPTVSESGVPGFEVSVWFGVVAPAGTPQPVISGLNTAFNEILHRTDVVDLFRGQGVNPAGGSPLAFSEFLRSQMTKWAKVVKGSGALAE